MKYDIKSIRMRVGLSIEELGTRSKVSPRTIYRIEKGRSKPSTNTLRKLAPILKTPLIKLINKYHGLSKGFKIRSLRLRMGLSQKELSEKAGLSSQTISNIEAGRFNPSINTLQILASALNTSFEKLFKEYYKTS